MRNPLNTSILCYLLFFISISAFGQKTITDTTFYDVSMAEVTSDNYAFRVIASRDRKDRLVGKKLVYDNSGLLIESISYRKGEKTGDYYKFDTVTQTSREGFLSEGNRTGKWEMKNADGSALATVTYNDNGRIIDHSYIAYKKDEEIVESHLLTTQATYRGGMQNWNQHLLKNLTMPRGALPAGKRVAVLTQFTVWQDGTLGNLETLDRGEKIPSALIDEAHRVILASGQWIPAIKDDKPVASNQLIRIVFQNAGTFRKN